MYKLLLVLLMISTFSCNPKSNELAILEYLTNNNSCTEDLNCFNDYYKALEYAKKVNKPIFIVFTGYACLSDRYFEREIISSTKIKKILTKNYVVVFLYVDDVNKLPHNEQITIEYNGKLKKLKTVGNKWAYFEYINFKQVSQPYFVLLSDNGELLTNPIGLSVKKNYKTKFTNYLLCGISAFKSLEASTIK